MVLKSRNTMVTSALLFLAVVILLRFSGAFLEDNVVRVVGTVFGGSAENVPLLDFSTVNVSWLDPSSWSVDSLTESVNGWMHSAIDAVLPAVIYAFNASMIHFAVITRADAWATVLVKGSTVV